jgi:hypothetical protein
VRGDRRERGGSGWLLALAVLLVTSAGATLAHARLIYRQVNLAYLTQRADVIVQGRVVEARYEPLPGYSHIPTVRVTLEVERMLRGPEGNRFSFRELVPPLEARQGKRGYLVGQRLLLFLPAASRYGLSSPLGGDQGRFRILRDAPGHEFVENGLRNAGLFKKVPEAAERAGARLTDEQVRLTATPRGPVPLKDFVSLVQHLTPLPRIQ